MPWRSHFWAHLTHLANMHPCACIYTHVHVPTMQMHHAHVPTRHMHADGATALIGHPKRPWGSLWKKPGVAVARYRCPGFGHLYSEDRLALELVNVSADLSSLGAHITKIGHGNLDTPCFKLCDLKHDLDQCMSTIMPFRWRRTFQ